MGRREEEGKMKKPMTRRDFLVAAGVGGGVGVGLITGGFVLAEKNLWPFTGSQAGTRVSFPRATKTGRIKEYTFEAAPATILRTVYTRAGVELTDPQEGCKLVDIKHKKIPRRNSHAQESDREYNT
jgi:hypothetical protein